jgi:hypothetical protein
MAESPYAHVQQGCRNNTLYSKPYTLKPEYQQRFGQATLEVEKGWTQWLLHH